MLLLVALMVPIGAKVHAQETLTVADGTTTNNYVPVYGYYADAYLRSQVIYPASDLAVMTGGTIEQLTFYASESSVSWGSASFVVKLAEVTQTSFSSSFIETTMTTVYSDTLSIVGGQMTVTFSTPYEYGGGNLLMEVDNMSEGSYVTSTWYGISANGASVSNYSYDSFSSISYASGRNFIPKTSFLYTTGVASCYGVKNLAAIDSMTTSESITISWIDTSNSSATYSVYLVTATDTIPLDNTSDNSFSVDTLQPNTSYTFGVVADCGGGDLSSMRTVTVRTACDLEAFPWSEDFSASLADNMCWRGARHRLSDTTALTLGAVNSAYWNYAENVYDGLPAGHYWVNIYGETRQEWLVTPTIDLSEVSEAALKFDVAFTGYYSSNPADVTDIADDKFVVLVSTTNGATWDTANAVYFNLPSLASSTYAQQIVDLSRYAGQVIRIAFYVESTVSGGDNDLHIDNLQVTEPPTCMPVANLTVANSLITAHTATLNWVSDAGSYQVEYKPAADTTWTIESVSDTFYVITDLAPVTTYNVRVKALCGGDESDYSSTLTFTTTVACPAPTNLRAVTTPGDGTLATILWEDLTGSAWQVCLNGDTNNLIDVTDTTALDFDTLTPETTYTVMVRRNCDDEGEGYSAWTSVVTFTPTDAYTFTVNDGTTTNEYVPIYGWMVDNGTTKSQFVVPAADLSTITYGIVNKLTFYASTENVPWTGASFNVYLTETADTGVSSLSPVADMEQVYSGSLSLVNHKMEITFSTPYQYMGGNLLVAFEQTTTGSYSRAYWYGVNVTDASMGGYGTSVSQRNFLPKMSIDYIPGEEPTCFPVNGLAVIDSMVTAESVTLTWVDSANSSASYNVCIIDDTNITIIGTTGDTEYTIDELSANTTYTFGVVADCGGDEALMRTVQVRTPCVAIAIDSLPWTESFESYPSGSYSGSNNAFNDPCWRVHDRYGDNYPYVSTSYKHSGNNALAIYASSSYHTIVALPPVDGDLSNLMVNLWVRSSSSSAYVEVGVMSNPDDASTFVSLLECRNTNTSSFENFEARLQNYTSGTIALRYTGSYNTVYVDDITIMVAPSCFRPESVSMSDISENEATIHINDTNEDVNYHIVILSGLDTVVNTTSYDTVLTIDTLQTNTSYTVNVSAICDDGTETGSVIASFRTTCIAETMPWSENFDSWTEKSYCWSFLSGAYNNGNGPATPYTSAWTLNSTYGDYIAIDGKALTMNLYSDRMYWAVTPAINITSENAMISVDVAVAQWTAATPNYDDNDSLIIAISTSEDTSFTTLQAYGNNQLNSMGNTYTTLYVPVNGYDGQTVRFAIYGGSTSGTSPYDNRIAIDNVTVGEPIGCFPTTGVVVDTADASSVTISWNSIEDASGYSLYNGTEYVGSTADTTYTFTGLEATTGYTFGVRTLCSASDSSDRISTVSAMTDCLNGSCDITLVMHDGYGDGWNGASIAVIQNGATVGQYTCSGAGSTETVSVCSGVSVALNWNAGSFDDEASFEVNDGVGQQVYACTNASTLSTSAAFTTIASPCPTCLPVSNLTVDEFDDNSITVSWTSDAGNYSVYLNNVYVANVSASSYTFTGLTEATAYTIGVTAICSDEDSSSMISISTRTDFIGGGCSIVITATDSYGDGWDGAYIDVLQNGESMGTCTVVGDPDAYNNVPVTDTFTFYVRGGVPVDFVWHESTASTTYPEEISFVIKNGNDSVLFSADLGDDVIVDTFFTVNDACDNSTPQPTQYTVTLGSADTNMGTVSPTGTQTVNEGTSFTATATANDGYHFVSWTDAAGATVSTANPYTFTVTADVTLTATFEANSTPTYYTVSVSSADTAMGTVSCTPSGSVEAGTSVTATATPANNHTFTGWVNAAGDTVSHANPYTFTVSADVTLVGTFRNDGVGIETVSLDNVNLYPNPASTSVTISGLEAKATVTLVDINGHVSGQWTAKDNTLTIDLTNYATGTYFVRIVGEQAMAVRKLIVK